jgi:uncharacterized protein (DUF2141 family)
MKGCTCRSWMIIAVFTSVILSCARQMPPSGGARDITPPKVVKSVPPYGSLNFRGSSIVITFDEYVVLDKMLEKFMISPPVNKKPTIILKGKSLNIEFQEKLRENTTYTLYFQDAIKDLNEGNPLINFEFVFSTGNVLDSLSVTGNAYNSFNLEPMEKTLITMYTQLADSAPVKLLPDYITQANINGGFRINNTRGGTYRLYALQDKNDNKKYDLGDEGFAFMDKPVEITLIKNYLPVIVVKDTTKGPLALKKAQEVPLIDGEFKLFLFTAPKKNHYLTSSGRKTANLLTYTLSLPPDSIKFEFNIPEVDPKSYFMEKNQTKDSIYVWLTDSLLSSKPLISTHVSYPFTDSSGVTKLKKDTINMRFTFTRAIKAKEARTRYTFTSNIQGGTIKPGQPVMFLSETPFRNPDTTKIRLYETLKAGRINLPVVFIKDSLNSRRYSLKAKLKEGSSYLFIADSASFGNIFGDVSDSAGVKFNVRTASSYGQLTMIVKNVTCSTIIQILDIQEKVILEKQINKDGNLEFPLLERGTYRFRAIYDLNGDGKWTTGDYKTKLQPEPVSYFPKEIEIRVDFQIEEEWDLSARNQKEQKLRAKKDANR